MVCCGRLWDITVIPGCCGEVVVEGLDVGVLLYASVFLACCVAVHFQIKNRVKNHN